MKILVTGSDSGIGKYLVEKLPNCVEFNRKTDLEKIKKTKFDVIIHCANNKTIHVDDFNLYKYTNDNVLLTYELTKIPCKKFIYFSTVDVYPKNGKKHNEQESIKVKDVDSIYGITKLMSEQIVKNNCKNHLILRPTALLGPYMKPNSLTKILDNEIISLSHISQLSYVLYKDILEFLKFALEKDIQGIFNVGSGQTSYLVHIAKKINRNYWYWGKYVYDIGDIDVKKIYNLFPNFAKPFDYILDEFLKERK